MLVGGPSGSGRGDFAADRRDGSTLTALRMTSLAAVIFAISSLSRDRSAYCSTRASRAS